MTFGVNLIKLTKVTQMNNILMTYVKMCSHIGCMYNRNTACFLTDKTIDLGFIERYKNLQTGEICTIRQQINEYRATTLLCSNGE